MVVLGPLTLGEGSCPWEWQKWKGDMLWECRVEVEMSWSAGEALEEEWAHSLVSPFAFERLQLSLVLSQVRGREERPPIMKLNDIHPKEPDEREVDTATSALVESAFKTVHSRPLESACCLVSMLEEVHLEKRGVVSQEEAGEEFSKIELVPETRMCGGFWGDVEDRRLAMEEESEWVGKIWALHPLEVRLGWMGADPFLCPLSCHHHRWTSSCIFYVTVTTTVHLT